MYLAVNKGIFYFFYFFKFLSLIIITYKSSCVSALPNFCGLCDMPKMFFPDKEDERNFYLCSGIYAYFR